MKRVAVKDCRCHRHGIIARCGPTAAAVWCRRSVPPKTKGRTKQQQQRASLPTSKTRGCERHAVTGTSNGNRNRNPRHCVVVSIHTGRSKRVERKPPHHHTSNKSSDKTDHLTRGCERHSLSQAQVEVAVQARHLWRSGGLAFSKHERQRTGRRSHTTHANNHNSKKIGPQCPRRRVSVKDARCRRHGILEILRNHLPPVRLFEERGKPPPPAATKVVAEQPLRRVAVKDTRCHRHKWNRQFCRDICGGLAFPKQRKRTGNDDLIPRTQTTTTTRGSFPRPKKTRGCERRSCHRHGILEIRGTIHRSCGCTRRTPTTATTRDRSAIPQEDAWL